MNQEEIILILNKLESIKITYKNRVINVKSYEKFISKVFLNALNSSEKKNLVIGADSDLSFIIFLIIAAIKGYYENMMCPENNILDILKDGDMVMNRSERCIYRGIYIIDGKRLIKLENAGGLTYIPLEKSHLITKYSGQAKSINKMKGFSKEDNSTKNFIGDLLNVSQRELTGVIAESILFVYRGKDRLFEIIDNIGIEHNNKKFSLSELFSLAYFSSEDHFEYFKGNKTKENILIKFVSNISIALDLVKIDSNIKTIVLVGENTYRDSIETEMRVMGIRKSLKKLIVFDTWKSTVDYSFSTDIEDKYSLYALTKDCMLSEIQTSDYSTDEKVTDIQSESQYLINNLCNRQVSLELIDNSNEINEIISSISKSLKLLCVDNKSDVKILNFIKIAYYLCNILEQTILPLNWCESNKNIILDNLDKLCDIRNEHYISSFEFKTMDDIVLKIDEFISKISDKNAKFEKLKQVINTNTKSLLVVKNEFEIKSLEKYLMLFKLRNTKIAKLSKNLNYKQYESVVFTFYYDNRYFNVFNNPEISFASFILHKREMTRLKSLERKNKEMMKQISKYNTLSCSNMNEILELQEEIFNDKSEDSELYKIEESIEKALNENWLNIIINDAQLYSSGSGNSKTSVKGIVKFEDNKYAFLSDNYQCNVIDRHNNDIKQKSASRIEIGDEVVFANTKSQEKGDVIKDTIEKLLEQASFRQMYGKYFKLNSLWKDLLIEYIEVNDLSVRDVCETFKLYNENIEPVTIINWLNGNVIGPRDSEHIKIVAKIINEEELSTQIDEVINSCRTVRSLQIQVRKAIARMIINSVVVAQNQENEIYDLVKSVIGDFSEYAYIGTVSSVENVDLKLSGAYVNRILEKEMD